MLKRYQVLLPVWLEDYLKWGVERSKVSFSEIIRLEVCLGVLATITELHPEYKPGLALKDILSSIKSFAKQQPSKDKVSNFLSTIYFETRKAIEYRYSKTQEK